ncbi:chemotaxis protein CheC [Caldisalinibacter kiritimatiensis]|uniref:Chemotaxis protein CheC--inhibitor of MCP methylation n=1 Tax=Caldisalinibacter kiritimatiensis TaxID=1304284 RepID=R1CLZ3_9FIRM|nr:chemotaxis protein CheC [Caldisalinibacter kiritimatiensis]EOC99730.1 Chemotaxis protein CheC -- inhibitor of MCP methylation [Caldisalinibacter kiritimatiensis]
MKVSIDNLNSMLLDVLKELGNIGAGNAATALAKMINKKVDMKVPKIKILDFKDVPDILGGEEKPVVGIYFQMNGDIKGNIMLVLDVGSARNLVDIMFNTRTNREKFDEMELSALSEVGNILSASYVNSLSTLINLDLKISVPSISIDMAGAILSVPAVQFGQVGDKVLFIETEFQEDEKQVLGDLFLIPNMESFETILKQLGVIENEG